MDPCVLLVTLFGWLTLCLIDIYSREAKGLIFSFLFWKIGKLRVGVARETTNQFGMALGDQ